MDRRKISRMLRERDSSAHEYALMTCSDVIYTSPLSDKYPKFTLE
jgi:hypothetical protein